MSDAREGRARGGAWRHEALAAELLREIARGDYAPGDTLPTERDIARAHGISRATVREAMRRLEAQGMVRRRQGAGTKVIASRPAPFTAPVQSLESLLSYPPDTVVRKDEDAPDLPEPLLAAALAPGDARAWRRIEVRRFVVGSDLPISHSRIWVPEAFGAVADHVDGSGVPVFALLERTFGVAAAEIRLRMEAVSVEGGLAARLQVAEGAAAVRIVRTYLDARGAPLQMSITTHPEGRYAFEVKLGR